MSKKMFFFDIDGTLITEDGNRIFPESAKRAIRLARDKGNLVYINTGRVRVNIEDSILDVGFDGCVCGCGTNIYTDGNEVLHNKLTKEKCREIAVKCRENNLMSIFEYKEHTAYDRDISGSMHQEILTYFKDMGKKLIDDIYSDEFIFDKFTFWKESDNPAVDEFLDYLRADFNCIRRGSDFYEIVPLGFTKATGIKFLQDYYNIPLEDVYVFGDSNNDLDMIKYATNSIAMGISSEEVKKSASYITDDVMHDGIYNAMKHFGVI